MRGERNERIRNSEHIIIFILPFFGVIFFSLVVVCNQFGVNDTREIDILVLKYLL